MTAGLRGLRSRTTMLCAAVLGLAELLVVFTRVGWIGFLDYTPEWANAGLYVASPLIAGVAAFLARSYLSTEVVGVTGGRSRLGTVRTVGAAWLRVFLLAVAVHAAVMGVALGTSLAFGASGSLAWQPFLYAVMPIAMACAIGVGLAAVIPHLWATVLSVLVTYAIWYLAATTDSFVPVNVGGATISLAGLTYRADAAWQSLAVAAAVTAAFLGVAALAVGRQSFAVAVSGFCLAAGSVVVAGALLGSGAGAERFTAGPAPDFSCAGSAPRICLTTAHSARLHETAQRVQSAGRHLTALGVDLSSTALFEESPIRRTASEGVLLLSFAQLNGLDAGDADYALALTRPSDCDEYHDAHPSADLERLLAASQHIAEWMDAKQAGTPPAITPDEARDLYRGLQRCSIPDRALPDARLG